MQIEFFVPGVAKPGGSKKAFWRPGMKHANIVEDCAKNKDWRASVGYVARHNYMQPPTSLPVEVNVIFYMLRPGKHFRAGNKAGRLKDNAPTVVTVKPDATKLWRAAEDALTGIIWVDDAQVWKQTIQKLYSDISGMQITIKTLDPLQEMILGHD